jgi:hypothetical protein
VSMRPDAMHAAAAASAAAAGMLAAGYGLQCSSTLRKSFAELQQPLPRTDTARI